MVKTKHTSIIRSYLNYKTFRLILTASDPVAPCRFDEGAPLVQTTVDGKQYIIGIFSQTAGCESGQPAVFTRLAPYYAWFEKYAKKQPIDVCGTITTSMP